MIYIVTGATGHVGNTLVKKLTANKHDVRVLVLPQDNVEMIKYLPIKIYYGNVLDRNSLLPLFDLSNTNYDQSDICLIHTAGIISISSKQNKLMEKVNIQGTKNIISLAQEFNVGHFVYISSVHAIPEPQTNTVITEISDFDPNKVIGPYAKTKATATKAVMEAYKNGLPTTIIHPSGIIGPYDFGNAYMTKLLEKYMNRKLNARINGHYDFVDVRDVVDAIYTATIRKAYGSYLITGELIELRTFFNTMQKIAGIKNRPFVVAKWFVKLFMPLINLGAKIKKETPLFTSYSLYTLTTHCNFSHEKATKDLDYHPRPLKETIIDTALWLIEQKRITKSNTIRYVRRYFISN